MGHRGEAGLLKANNKKQFPWEIRVCPSEIQEKIFSGGNSQMMSGRNRASPGGICAGNKTLLFSRTTRWAPSLVINGVIPPINGLIFIHYIGNWGYFSSL